MSGSIIKKIKNKLKHLIYKGEWYENYWCGVTKFWSLNDFNIDVVNLGSNSGKYSFNYDNIPIKGMNWAVGPQSLQHDFNILRNYFSFIKENGTVIISLCPFSCLFSKYNKAHNFKYYTFLHPAMIQNFEEEERIRALKYKNNLFKEEPDICIKIILKQILSSLKGNKKQVDFHKNAVQFINMWKKQFSIDDLNTTLSDKHTIEQEERSELLNKMICFCIERNLKPIIVIPPIHSELSSLLTKEFRENYIYTFIKKSNKNNVPFYDYIDNTKFQKDEYFINSFYMNKKGAEEFTKHLLSELKLI